MISVQDGPFRNLTQIGDVTPLEFLPLGRADPAWRRYRLCSRRRRAPRRSSADRTDREGGERADAWRGHPRGDDRHRAWHRPAATGDRVDRLARAGPGAEPSTTARRAAL